MKSITKSFVFAAALVAALIGNVVRAAQLETGTAAPDFTLTDINGKSHTLSAYKGKVVVLEWVNPECPLVVKHYSSGNMQKTQKAAVDSGVVWLAINSASYEGAQGNYDEKKAAEWLKKENASVSAYLRDQTGKIGKSYHATNTPHMYIIDQKGTLVYQGAIDSIPTAKVEDIAKATNYVTVALESLKAGKPIEKATTKAYGCSVKYGKDT